MKDFFISSLPRSNAFLSKLLKFDWTDLKLKNKAFECLKTMQEVERKQIEYNNQN